MHNGNPNPNLYKWCSNGKHFELKTEFGTNSTKWDGLQGSCYTHTNQRGRQYHHDVRREQRTGMPASEYDRLYEEQRGCCAACGSFYPTLCADHDHSTGRPRKLLCSDCNTALGLVKDSPTRLEALANYLRG